ncbi:hypothetical protein ZIOFF_059759 [Zingiber officinale]|uniref:Large ribosomal subunit protein bL9c n=1 Tax=Zingiber officinale TaxID=94328 RepID=A0A8J5F9P7_ZINOF|nr:hypothetical protein ZIOFF_059759 [Zingiber officinale]
MDLLTVADPDCVRAAQTFIKKQIALTWKEDLLATVNMSPARCCGAAVFRHLLGSQSSSLANITDPFLFSAQGVRHRKLEVILTTTINKLGKAGDTVKVAPGHFRNQLMPKLLAVPNIEKYAFLMREQRKLYQRDEVELAKEAPITEQVKEQEETSDSKAMQEKLKEYQAAARRLDNARLTLWRYIKVDNEIRTPVTKDDIVAEMRSTKNIVMPDINLQLGTIVGKMSKFLFAVNNIGRALSVGSSIVKLNDFINQPAFEEQKEIPEKMAALLCLRMDNIFDRKKSTEQR